MDRFTYVGAAAIGALVDTLTEGLAVPIMEALLAGITWDVLNVCKQPDPGDPGLNALDFAALADITNIAVYQPAVDRVMQWFTHMMWPIWCNCADGTAPPGSTTTALPPQGTNTGLPSGSAAGPCWDVTQVFQTTTPGSDLSRLFLPWIQPKTVSPPPYGGTEAPLVPAILNGTVYWRATCDATSTPANPPYALMQTYLPNGAWGGSPYMWNFTGSAPFAPQSGSIQINATQDPNWQVLTYGAAPGVSIQAEIYWLCPGQTPNTISVPCCPPDPSVDIRLRSIQDMLMYVMDHLPTSGTAAYQRGTVHTGVTGTGTLNVSGLFGVLVEITQGVPTDPQLPGVPPYQWSVGWISMLTGDGMIDEIRITRQAQVWASRIAPYATVVGYQINAGFVANITELLPM